MARTIGAIRDLASARPGDHVCWTFSSDAEHREGMVSYLAAGVERYERLVYFGDRYTADDIDGYLLDGGFSADELRDRGQLIVAPARAAYMPDGAFTPAAMVQAFGQHSDQAVADGFTGLRAAGETEWLLGDAIDPDGLFAYEHDCDVLLASGARLIGLCTFDLRSCDPEDAAAAQAVHNVRAGTDLAGFSIAATVSGELVLHGELDAANARVLARALRACDRGISVTMNMNAVTFIDVVAARQIASAALELGQRGGRVTIAGVTPLRRRIFAAFGLDRAPFVSLN